MDYLRERPVRIVVTDPRTSKVGDHRPPDQESRLHRISVNGDLGPYHFLITLVHEFAHAEVWERYKRKVPPHGKEWKKSFRDLMAPYMAKPGLFPDDLHETLSVHLKDPPASCLSDSSLTRKLREHEGDSTPLTVEEIPAETVFRTKSGKTFKKGKRARKRFRCTDVRTGYIYMVHPLAEAIPLQERNVSN